MSKSDPDYKFFFFSDQKNLFNENEIKQKNLKKDKSIQIFLIIIRIIIKRERYIVKYDKKNQK